MSDQNLFSDVTGVANKRNPPHTTEVGTVKIVDGRSDTPITIYPTVHPGYSYL